MIIPTLSGFDWDSGNRAKCEKHGVSPGEIEALFRAAPAVYADPNHSWAEQRLRAIGWTEGGRALLVAFTLRVRDGATLIRPISARHMHQKEIRRYEQGRAEETPRPEDG